MTGPPSMDERPVWFRNGMALPAVAVSFALRACSYSFFGSTIPYLFFYPPIVFTSLYGGFGPGVLSVCLSGLAAAYFIEPVGEFRIASPVHLVGMLVFVMISLLIVWTFDRTHRANRRAAQSEAAKMKAELFAEQAIGFRDAAERLTKSLESRRIGVWDLDLATNSAWRSPHHDRIFGYESPLPQWTYDMFLNHVLEEDRPMVDQAFHAAMAAHGQWSFECRIRRTDGEVRWIWAQGSHSEDQSHIQGLVQDVTERKATEQENSRLAAIVQSADDAIIGKALDGIVTSWNSGAEKIYGYAAADVLGKSITILSLPEIQDEETRIIEQVRRGERVEHYETVRLRKDGTQIDVSMTVSPIYNAEGRIVGASGISRDITERKRIEKERRQLNEELGRRSADLAVSNKELEAFAYSVSHDLRSPLRTIDGFAQALLEDYGDKLDASGHDHLQRVRAAAQRMARLIDDLLSLSRVTRLEMNKQTVDLSSMARLIMTELQATEPDRKVDFLIKEGVRAVGDTQLLRLVMQNLLGNAWKFTARREHAVIEFGVKEHEGEPAYFVRDNGSGFDMAFADKLFGVFQRLHKLSEFPGTGVGLATVQRVIHRHGGSVWADAAVDKGATFSFTL